MSRRADAKPHESWKCADCGGRLSMTAHEHTDASATEHYECVRCGAEGSVDYFHGPDSPTWHDAAVPNTDGYGGDA